MPPAGGGTFSHEAHMSHISASIQEDRAYKGHEQRLVNDLFRLRGSSEAGEQQLPTGGKGRRRSSSLLICVTWQES